jgi:hypothetical protein
MNDRLLRSLHRLPDGRIDYDVDAVRPGWVDNLFELALASVGIGIGLRVASGIPEALWIAVLAVPLTLAWLVLSVVYVERALKIIRAVTATTPPAPDDPLRRPHLELVVDEPARRRAG